MSATFDTSGEVYVGGIRYTFDCSAGPGPRLSPFTQGYVEAVCRAAEDTLGGFTIAGVRFSDLAPETLARIMEDCAAWQKQYRAVGNFKQSGRQFWELRTAQHVERNTFPPLTPYLGDDGKVYLKDHPPGGNSHEG